MRPGFLVMDKPPGWTSHDVVAVVRAVTGVKKVGHTGTLDPFASGVLPLALGKATRAIRFLDEKLKVYDATISLGSSTTTGDPEGEVLREAPLPSFENLDEVIASFVGPRMQTPPAYSAVKVKGKPLYKYAREGKTVEAKARPIEIFGLEVLERQADSLRIDIRCSRGSYARVLADEIAEALGSAGHLSALRRLQSGPFEIQHCLSMSELADIVAGTEDWDAAFRRRGEDRMPWKPRDEVRARLEERLRSPFEVLSHLPSVKVPQAGVEAIRSQGMVPPPPSGLEAGGAYTAHDGARVLVVATSENGKGKAVIRFVGGPNPR
ncbi:MAG: tRNA pseudouridine(55) synthase TruB [Myxococcota bacterium]|nr:tRNA pseudouridine(55) synthase TruB [Myxococcota bacterium]